MPNCKKKKTKTAKGEKAHRKMPSLDQTEALKAITGKGAKLWSRMNKKM